MVTVESTNVESTSEAATGTRRDFLYIATGAAAAVGTLAALFPMIDQMEPDASALAAGGPVDFDVSKLQPGQQAVVRWRSRPIFIVNRPPAPMGRRCPRGGGSWIRRIYRGFLRLPAR